MCIYVTGEDRAMVLRKTTLSDVRHVAHCIPDQHLRRWEEARDTGCRPCFLTSRELNGDGGVFFCLVSLFAVCRRHKSFFIYQEASSVPLR